MMPSPCWGGKYCLRCKEQLSDVSIEEVVRRSPDAIIIGMAANMESYSANLLKRLMMLEAVRKGRVCYVNDDLYRLGPESGEGASRNGGPGEMRKQIVLLVTICISFFAALIIVPTFN